LSESVENNSTTVAGTQDNGTAIMGFSKSTTHNRHESKIVSNEFQSVFPHL
jgi:hypothetical protein